MIRVRKAAERGHFDHGWLDTYHTFSFGDYYDPANPGFRGLRVTKDSLGNGSIIRAGQLQRMTAGTGVRHSEFNPSDKEAVHLYQIWLLPERTGLKPRCEGLG